MTFAIQTNPADIEAPTMTLSNILKLSTYLTHQSVDDLIRESGALDCVTKYQSFVKFQYHLMADVEPLYQREDLGALIPDLPSRSRLAAAERDAKYLNVDLEENAVPKLNLGDLDIPEALGWLYVVEGSNLGAAFLFKAAQKLGFGDDKGASHLAAAPAGRAAHWRSFVASLNAVPQSVDQDSRSADAAFNAFGRVRVLIGAHLS